MAGLYFGTSRWDDLPRTLGLQVAGGVMSGSWQGIPVQAEFTNRYDRQTESYYHYTCLSALLDPPLGLHGLEGGEALNRIVDAPLRAAVEARTAALRLRDLWFGDTSVYAEYAHYESAADRYAAAFEVLTWAARIVQERRAKSPPPWEVAIRATWPALAKGWSFHFDARRGLMEGTARGRATSARVVVKQGAVTTHVHVAAPFPEGATLALTRQEAGFWSSLLRGQDIVVGDPAFDAAFVVKGEPEAFVRAALNPPAREQIMGMIHSGASITLEDGKLAAWTNQLLTSGEQLDALMKAAHLAAEALCPPRPAQDPGTPYR